MSALRIDTLRLVWLEAFVAVAETENMSEAAGLLGVSQPSVSRYLQALEAWTGKKLVEAGGVHDPENARVSIALTDEGRDFFGLAQAVLTDLTNFRSSKARYQEARDDAEAIIGKMEADLRKNANNVVRTIRKNIELFRNTIDNIPVKEHFEGAIDNKILNFIESYRRNIRIFFNEYENRCAEAKKRTKLKARRAPSRPV